VSLVYGLENFKEWMSAFSDSYVLIGGSACNIPFNQNGEDFRLTKDLDIVVLTDKADKQFATAFWSFIKNGGYKCGGRNDTAMKYYRFTLPEEQVGRGFPEVIELFARHPDFELRNKESEIAPLPFDDDVSDLSAIILDGEYYDFLCSGVVMVNNIPIVDTLHIIPLKMRAHIDLNNRHSSGARLNDRDLKKHRNDVIRLSELLAPNDRIALNGQMIEDTSRFLADLQLHLQQLTRAKEKSRIEETIQILRDTYL
jgi:hypothetical protein